MIKTKTNTSGTPAPTKRHYSSKFTMQISKSLKHPIKISEGLEQSAFLMDAHGQSYTSEQQVCTAQHCKPMTNPKWLFKFQLKTQFFSSTSHISSAQQPHVASDYHIRQYRLQIPIATENSIGLDFAGLDIPNKQARKQENKLFPKSLENAVLSHSNLCL